MRRIRRLAARTRVLSSNAAKTKRELRPNFLGASTVMDETVQSKMTVSTKKLADARQARRTELMAIS
jgi:hypothetical protein